jgi:hypothetical protein
MSRARAARHLGVRPTASADEINAAFRRRSRAAHPDLGGDADAFGALLDARRVLLSPPSTSAAPVTVVSRGEMRRRRWGRAWHRLVRRVIRGDRHRVR